MTTFFGLLYRGLMDQVIHRLFDPAAIYLLWPSIILLVLIQLYSSRNSQDRRIYAEKEIHVAQDSFGVFRNSPTSDITTVKESYFEEQSSFMEEADVQDYCSFLTNDGHSAPNDDSFCISLPKVQPEIVRFSKDDIKEGIGIKTVARNDSLLVRKVYKGSAACGRVCAGDRISAVNGISFTVGENLGEKLRNLFEETVSNLQPFEITIVKGSRLSDVGINRLSKRFSAWFGF